jgi:hypothetical protein
MNNDGEQAMHTIEDIIDRARQLPRQDQRRLLEELEDLLDQESTAEEFLIPEKSYSRSLGLAGTLRTEFTDVSADKYKHLAEAYADNDDNG